MVLRVFTHVLTGSVFEASGIKICRGGAIVRLLRYSVARLRRDRIVKSLTAEEANYEIQLPGRHV